MTVEHATNISETTRAATSRSQAVTRSFEEDGELPPSFRRAARDWCVDTDTSILTLSTFQLWEALERGHVQPWMRVWREGMECWTPAGEMPEFAWALAQTPGPMGEAVALSTRPSAPTSPERPSSSVPPPPASGVRWIALGSVVAAAAVACALFVTRGAAVVAPARATQLALTQLTPVAAAAGAQERMPSAADEDGAPRSARRSPPHVDRGQERMPRRGGSASR